MFRYLIVIFLLFPMCGIVSANEPTETENSSSLEALEIAEEILSIKALGRGMTLEGLRELCISAHPLKKDEFTKLRNEMYEKNMTFVEKYLHQFFDPKRSNKKTKLPKLQAEKLVAESHMWSFEYLKKIGITNESPSLESCIDGIKNFPLVP